ncbi:hypothetical protein ACFOTA_00370 [Chitinophaga sp. GCM10012297]|uniref:Secreted protein n=1 Tax=Chitinophaga chungangae TaxID=2821488 RepID=A0ABS3Y7J5_9BACT|nr:hypothetical protein [Chitinophaga chungangae]MBO9150644.1 hypothetical protein [Chitinophaga chungangae]
MRYLFVITVLAGLMLQTFGKGLVLAEFMLNQDYIARVLCINKAKPKLACNGQCQLMKKMEQETKKEQSGNAVKDKYEVIFSETAASFNFTPAVTAVKLYSAGTGYIPARPLYAVFHPPRA